MSQVARSPKPSLPCGIQGPSQRGLDGHWFVLSWVCISPGSPRPLCDRRELREQSGEEHQLPRAGETPPGTKARQQQQCYLGDLRQQILAGHIRAKQDLEFDQAHVTWQIKDSRCPALVPSLHYPISSFSCFLSLLCSLLCFLCDVVESWVSSILSSLLETRGSNKGLETRIRKQLPIGPHSDGPLLTASHAPICPCFAACPSTCPLLCGGLGLHSLAL